MEQERIAVILPARNEAEAIGQVIDEIRELPIQCAIIVADSDSNDETAMVAVDRGACVLSCSQGKGKAIRAALLRVKADYIFMLNSDYTYPAESIVPMLEKLRGGKLPPQYDAMYGWRHRIEDGAMTKWHKVGNRLLTWLANALYGPAWTEDLCSGMWGFRGETAEFLAERLTSDGFTLEADIFSSLALSGRSIGCGKSIGYIEIGYRKRLGDKPKLKIWDAFEIAWFLVKRRITSR